MKNDLAFIVQECICIDLLINAIITSNTYIPFNFFNKLKKENLKNINLICHLYKNIYNDNLLIKNKQILKLDNSTENNLNELLKSSFKILTRIAIIKKQYINFYHNNIFKELYNSYFDFISYIQYFYPLSFNNYFYFKNEKSNISNFKTKTIYRFFNILEPSYLDIYYNDNENKIEYIRNISLEAISIFFDCELSEDLIIDEYYEIFFENNPENKFYQFFFKTNDRIFKSRIYDKSLVLFYLYQNINQFDTYNPLNKLDSKLYIDEFLKNKFKDKFENLSYDENYINSSYFNNNIELYKFKYNFKNGITEKSLYISINVNNNIIQEIYLI